jgi:hypothetical protein
MSLSSSDQNYKQETGDHTGSDADISSGDNNIQRVISNKKLKVRRSKQCKSRRNFLHGKLIFKVKVNDKPKNNSNKHILIHSKQHNNITTEQINVLNENTHSSEINIDQIIIQK